MRAGKRNDGRTWRLPQHPTCFVMYRKNGQRKREAASAVRWESVFMGRLYFPPRRKKKVMIRNSSCILCVCPFNGRQLSCHASRVLKTAVLGRQNLNPPPPSCFQLLSFGKCTRTHAHSHTNLQTDGHDSKWKKITNSKRKKTQNKGEGMQGKQTSVTSVQTNLRSWGWRVMGVGGS